MTEQEVIKAFNIESNSQADPRIILLFIGIVFLFVTIIIFMTFTYSKKKISYNFMQDIVPKTKVKYDELREFLQNHPLPKHKYINEFLAFSIAFGFDDSWYKDFGLDSEIMIHETNVESFLEGNN
jgi:hypothetical protein